MYSSVAGCDAEEGDVSRRTRFILRTRESVRPSDGIGKTGSLRSSSVGTVRIHVNAREPSYDGSHTFWQGDGSRPLAPGFDGKVEDMRAVKGKSRASLRRHRESTNTVTCAISGRFLPLLALDSDFDVIHRRSHECERLSESHSLRSPPTSPSSLLLTDDPQYQRAIVVSNDIGIGSVTVRALY